jgi:hypothetical protein
VGQAKVHDHRQCSRTTTSSVESCRRAKPSLSAAVTGVDRNTVQSEGTRHFLETGVVGLVDRSPTSQIGQRCGIGFAGRQEYDELLIGVVGSGEFDVVERESSYVGKPEAFV